MWLWSGYLLKRQLPSCAILPHQRPLIWLHSNGILRWKNIYSLHCESCGFFMLLLVKQWCQSMRVRKEIRKRGRNCTLTSGWDTERTAGVITLTWKPRERKGIRQRPRQREREKERGVKKDFPSPFALSPMPATKKEETPWAIYTLPLHFQILLTPWDRDRHCREDMWYPRPSGPSVQVMLFISSSQHSASVYLPLSPSYGS